MSDKSEETQDVSALCDWLNPDDESLPLTKCVCGKAYQAWDFTLGIYLDEPRTMPCCGRKLFFKHYVRVLEVREEIKPAERDICRLRSCPTCAREITSTSKAIATDDFSGKDPCDD